MLAINEFNKKKFINIFKNVFEGADWLAKDLYNQKPFINFQELKSAMLKIFKKTSNINQLKILINHPDLADKVKISFLTKDSYNEQKNSKLDQCSVKEYNEFKKLNTMYKKKFGFPFIYAVAGKEKNDILNTFRSRYLLDKDVEFNQAKIQVIKIAKNRLKIIEQNYI